MSLANNLKAIEEELDKYNDWPKDKIFDDCIKERLKSTLLRYNDQIDLTSDYLLHVQAERVLKALTKIKKNDDLDVIKQNFK